MMRSDESDRDQH